jgi:hypothetical protein
MLALVVTAQVEFQKQNMKAVHHILVSRDYFREALSKWLSSVQLAPSYRVMASLSCNSSIMATSLFRVFASTQGHNHQVKHFA